MPKNCTNCGHLLNDADKFCSACGEKQVTVDFSDEKGSVSKQEILADINNILTEEIEKLGALGGELGGKIGGFLAGGSLIGKAGSLGGKRGGSRGARFGAKLMHTDEVHDKITLQKNLTTSMTEVINAMSAMGKLIDTSKYKDNHLVAGTFGVGFANMNPAVICVEFGQVDNVQTELYISGYAKEGLIKQKTALKAIEKLKTRIAI